MRLLALAPLASLLALVACSSSNPADGATDSGGDVAAACGAPLSDEATYDTAPLPAWCAKSNGLGGGRSTKTCDGYQAMLIGEGVDCSTIYVFDASTKKLVGKLHGCNFGHVCVEGVTGFKPPSAACLDDNGFGFGAGSLCSSPDGGIDGDVAVDSGDAAAD